MMQVDQREQPEEQCRVVGLQWLVPLVNTSGWPRKEWYLLNVASFTLDVALSRVNSSIRDHSEPKSFKIASHFSRHFLKTGYCNNSRPMPHHWAPCPVNMKLTRGGDVQELGIEDRRCNLPFNSALSDATITALCERRERRSQSVYARLSSCCSSLKAESAWRYPARA